MFRGGGWVKRGALFVGEKFCHVGRLRIFPLVGVPYLPVFLWGGEAGQYSNRYAGTGIFGHNFPLPLSVTCSVSFKKCVLGVVLIFRGEKEKSREGVILVEQ